ncbi:hypothetical protein [Streptomyces xiaopingdaonensis]|uniref:hypothetical protein n=1 Tax=Streptomyces xiaopingdaonensis TaxID=1565415 RepID=UPI0002E678BB|nr:hypothetical protein [Streptomyces xiaopingdaonensis]
MRYRLTFAAGLAVGYVLGSKAGRERYEQLAAATRRIAENPAVRNAGEAAVQTGREAAAKAVDAVGERTGYRLPPSVSARIRYPGGAGDTLDEQRGRAG